MVGELNTEYVGEIDYDLVLGIVRGGCGNIAVDSLDVLDFA